jgi:GNAT superfamily N-acetyltransferase
MTQEGYAISGDKKLISIDRVCELLAQSYWAQQRSREAVERSIENSLCWGVYFKGEQVGFARAVTDCATIYWLCDVIIDEKHRGKGLGKALVDCAVNSKELAGLRGILATKDAHGLYGQYGFESVEGRFMVRMADGR